MYEPSPLAYLLAWAFNFATHTLSVGLAVYVALRLSARGKRRA